MLTNFEEQTHELKPEEKKLIPIIIKKLNERIGKDRAMSSTYICSKIDYFLKYKLTKPRLRKIIHYIRVKNKLVFLCGTNKGYYIAKNKDEFQEWLESYEQRIRSMLEVFEAGQKQLEFQDKYSQV